MSDNPLEKTKHVGWPLLLEKTLKSPITSFLFAATFEIIASQPITNINFGQMVSDKTKAAKQQGLISFSDRVKSFSVVKSANIIYSNKGFRGFYVGIIPTLASKGAGKFMKLTIFDGAYKFFSKTRKNNIPLSILLASAVTTVIEAPLRTPLENVRTQIIAPDSKQKSVFPVTYRLVQQRGFVDGFWRGTSATFLFNIIYNPVFFGLYMPLKDWLDHRYQDKRASPILPAAIGAFSGATAAVISHPAEVIRSRMQYGQEKSLWAVGKALWYDGGFPSLYRGWQVKGIRYAVATSALTTALFYYPRMIDQLFKGNQNSVAPVSKQGFFGRKPDSRAEKDLGNGSSPMLKRRRN